MTTKNTKKPTEAAKPKREKLHQARIKVYFDDGASITWSVRPGGPASRDRDVLASELIRFAETIKGQQKVQS